MLVTSVNWGAVVVSAILYFIVGGLWYSPLLFAKQWMKLNKIDPNAPKRSPLPAMVTSFISGLVMAVVLAVLLRSLHVDSVGLGILCSLLLTIGFVGSVVVTNHTFEGRGLPLFLINVGYPVVGNIVMAIVLTLWM